MDLSSACKRSLERWTNIPGEQFNLSKQEENIAETRYLIW